MIFTKLMRSKLFIRVAIYLRKTASRKHLVSLFINVIILWYKFYALYNIILIQTSFFWIIYTRIRYYTHVLLQLLLEYCTRLHIFFSFLSGSPEVASDVHVSCNSDEIVVSINTRSGRFNGMIYPKGLSKNSTCMGEWVQRPSPIQYTLPLRGCNTMSTELVSIIYH